MNILLCELIGKLDLSITNWITIISIIIVITGWFINGYLSRKQEISKERLKYRLETLNYCIEVLFMLEKINSPLEDIEFNKSFKKAKKQLYFFGTSKETHLFDEIEEGLFNNPEDITDVVNKFRETIKSSINIVLELK